MKVESAGLAVSVPKAKESAADQVDFDRREVEEGMSDGSEAPPKDKVQPEELLDQIHALTEDGLYSVRFENDEKANELVVKIVDTETEEVLRQVPAEELLKLSARLEEVRGNIVNTVG
jgi:flagellar protein FlaG